VHSTVPDLEYPRSSPSRINKPTPTFNKTAKYAPDGVLPGHPQRREIWTEAGEDLGKLYSMNIFSDYGVP